MVARHVAFAAIAAVALVGCASTGEKKQTEVTAAQTEAERSLAKARQQQEAALDQQRKADAAAAEVRKKEQELAEAQSTAQQERRKAEQMQREAQEATERAGETAQTSQEEAIEEQREQRAEQAEPRTISGTLVGAGHGRITVDREGEQLELSVAESAQVTLDGKEAADVSDLPIGSEVRVAYTPDRPLPEAHHIDAISEGAAPVEPPLPEPMEDMPELEVE